MRYTSVKYDTNKYNFKQIVTDLFSTDLAILHESSKDKYEELFKVGADSSTIFHKMFYEKYRSGWSKLEETYFNFIKEVIFPDYSEDILYQKFPTFRVHLPRNIAVGAFHRDFDFHHPIGEINYVLPLTDSEDTASIWVESECGKKDFEAMSMKSDSFILFHGNQLEHGNKVNETEFTRVSMDFRVLPISFYREDAGDEGSMTLNTKFKEGQYYRLMKK